MAENNNTNNKQQSVPESNAVDTDKTAAKEATTASEATENVNEKTNKPAGDSTAPAKSNDQSNIKKPDSTVKDNRQSQKVIDDIANILNEVRRQTGSVDTSASATAAPVNDNSSEEELIDISSVEAVTPVAATQTFPVKEVKSAQQPKRETQTTNKKPAETKTQAVENKPKAEKKSSHLFAKIFAGFIVAAVLTGVSAYGISKINPEVVPASTTVKVPGGTVKAVESQPVFLKGIKIAGVDVGGKTPEEVKSLLAIRGTSLIPDISLTVSYEGVDYSYKKQDFDFTYDINQVVDTAFKFSKSVSDAGSSDILSTAPGDGSANVDTTNKTVDFNIKYQVTQSSVQKVIKRIAKKVDVPCVEPHVSKFDTKQSKNSKRYTFKEGSDGKAIDQDQLITDAIKQFNQGEKNVKLTATSYESKPTLKMADVKKATKLIGKFSTITTNTYNANCNMETALNSINGTILEPGATLSFNDCTGNSNLTENGYLEAGVIQGGAMTSGVGGGVCQAATTLYNAAIMANMEIVEREPHLWCSYYVYGGLDATIDWGNIDLKVKNNSNYQMFFRCWMDGSELNVEIYGWQSPDFDEVRTESELDWSSSEAYGYLAYRVFYKNGKEVKREELPYSQYSLSNGGGIRGADPGNVSTKLKQPE
ncbi:MAG: VanW family protein [Ruminococcus sp.]|nr:VanW family protein [Ruminococcus sp.]MDD6447411.1 VanW family protein [Ruminococcus sp.]